MNEDDRYPRGRRGYRGARRPGPARRSRPDARDGGLFDRVMRDVASWFDLDEDAEPPGRRSPGRYAYRDARGNDYSDDFGDARSGSVFEQDADAAGREGRPAGGRDASPQPDRARRGGRRAAPERGDDPGPRDDYDDEDRETTGSLRGKGPKGYRRSDERLTELVSDALHDDERVDASDIEVMVSDGEVTLGGSVASRRHKHRAENVAARVAGIDDVDNRLRVRRPPGREGAGGAGGTPAGARWTPEGEADRDEDDYGHP